MDNLTIEDICIKTEYIKLNQLLKLSGIISTGSDAKLYVTEGAIEINGNTVSELRKKVYPGDLVKISMGECSLLRVVK